MLNGHSATAHNLASFFDDTELMHAAEEFLADPEFDPVREDRIRRIRDEIAQTAMYRHNAQELEVGARLAWRNHARCIGRLQWRSLRVADRRDCLGADEVFQACLDHVQTATNGGKIRPLITIFAAQHVGGCCRYRIWNSQLIRYGCWEDESTGRLIGDPLNYELTRAIENLGWRPPRGQPDRFVVLPLVIETPHQRPQLYDLPPDAVLEVPIIHPEFDWFSRLDLRWHALPAISNMELCIGGLHYPAAPFNGWYAGYEIGARNLADKQRYNMLPAVARGMGLDPATEPLWVDKASLELNRAVLHSYHAAGVTLVDHHQVTAQFELFCQQEEAHGRVPFGEWSWLVPPLVGATCPSFHRSFDNTTVLPNFFYQADAWRR